MLSALPPLFVLAYVAVGCVVGFIAGLLGVGGGAVAVPVLVALLTAQGLPAEHVVHVALGTSMAAMVATSLSSFRSHWRHGNVLAAQAWRLAPAVILGTFAATAVATRLPARGLALFFAAFMAWVAWTMLRGAARAEIAQPRPVSTPLTLLAGLGIGAISALVSIGGGSLTVPFLHAQGIDIKKAIGTSAAVGFPIAIAGAVGYIVNGWSAQVPHAGMLGLVYWPAAVAMACTSVLLAPVGARLAQRMPVAPLKRVFGLLVIGLSLKMLWSVLTA